MGDKDCERCSRRRQWNWCLITAGIADAPHDIHIYGNDIRVFIGKNIFRDGYIYNAQCVHAFPSRLINITQEVVAALMSYGPYDALKCLPQPIAEEIAEHILSFDCDLTKDDFVRILREKKCIT
jgi:hypothetical protein